MRISTANTFKQCHSLWFMPDRLWEASSRSEVACGRTYCSNSGTPYHRLQHGRTTFIGDCGGSGGDIRKCNRTAFAAASQV